jgi:hypothetical protein
MQVRYRHGRPDDILHAGKLLEPDRPLYAPEIWELMPRLLSDLLHRRRIRICVFEDVDAANEMVCFGVTGFVRPGPLERALENGSGLADFVLTAESLGKPVFLNHKQIAEANRRDDLRSLTFFGVVSGSDLNDASTQGPLTAIMDGWTFFHRGFSLAEFWFEPVTALLMESMDKTGMRLLRERNLPCGTTAKVFRLTRTEAAELMPNWPAWIMFSQRPRFGFTLAEQRLLELALLDYSDRDAAEEMGVTSDAIKKRWRSIYARISRVEPAVFRPDLNGADQRRDLLHTLRNNLQEIRPY